MNALEEFLLANCYENLRTINGVLCGTQKFVFTTGLVVGLDAAGYERRYCYEHGPDALAALEAWDGTGHPPGPWIKCKGWLNGSFVDLSNPARAEA
jgi:hypothetical protein